MLAAFKILKYSRDLKLSVQNAIDLHTDWNKNTRAPPARRVLSRPQCISPTLALTYPNSALHH